MPYQLEAIMSKEYFCATEDDVVFATGDDDKNVSDIKFDIDKWKKYLNTNGYEGVLYKILFSNQKTLELMPNYSGGEYLDAFGDDNFNPLINDFHKNIFICLGLDVKDFLCKTQESIFDELKTFLLFLEMDSEDEKESLLVRKIINKIKDIYSPVQKELGTIVCFKVSY